MSVFVTFSLVHDIYHTLHDFLKTLENFRNKQKQPSQCKQTN